MKFGYKLFLTSFILIVAFTSVIGISLINNNFNNNMDNEINKNINEANTLIYKLLHSSYTVVNTTNYDAIKVWINARVVIAYSKDGLLNTTIMDGEDYFVPKNNNENDYKTNIFIKDKKMYVTSKASIFRFIIKVDISSVYETKTNNINFFIKLSLISSFLIALVLSIFISILTRKIKILNKASEEIEKGNYNILIPSLGNDEIGMFANTFKNMLNAINNNINEIKTISENRKLFIGNLTHEIRTPLTSIIGYSSLIKNNKVTDLKVIKNYNKRIYDEGKYIEELRDKLMNLVALDNNTIILEKENISKNIIDILDNLQEIYHQVTFIKSIQENVYKDIDVTLFKSLVINLVSNSIKASNKPIINIELNDNYLIVEDNGMGINANEIEKIKEPFYTLSKDRNRENGGLGLGMPLIIKIVGIHNWHFQIESEVNVGTKVTIKLGSDYNED